MTSDSLLDRTTSLERIRARLEQEWRDANKVREANQTRLLQLKEELETIGQALDWARRTDGAIAYASEKP